MKNAIIVSTDFSVSAANAVSYACALALDYDLRIIVTHLCSIPVSYAAEGTSLASINDALETAQQTLTGELSRVKREYPGIDVETRLISDGFVDGLQALANEVNAEMIIIGALAAYADLWLWNNEWLDALISLSRPVLVIPAHIIYRPIRHIAFACDYRQPCTAQQASTIARAVTLSGARLSVVHVAAQPMQSNALRNSSIIAELLHDLNPGYYTIEDRFIIRGLAAFVQDHEADLLITIPRRHGLWHSLFNKSYTRQLALLNNMPVMSLPGKDE